MIPPAFQLDLIAPPNKQALCTPFLMMANYGQNGVGFE
jgi:hypothetical protein